MPAPENTTVPDQMVFTIADGPAKSAFTGAGQRVEGDETGEALLRRWLSETVGHTKVIRPDDREFVSATPEAHRKGEKAYHVKAHRGSKDGTFSLSFLSLCEGEMAADRHCKVTYFSCLRGSYSDSRNRSYSFLSRVLNLFRTHLFFNALSISISPLEWRTTRKLKSLSSP